jgi:DNA polymerase III epsilon subunit-like protein
VNGNEGLIILLAIIMMPILGWMLFAMPNDKRCNSCGSPLSSHRQKSYFLNNSHGQSKEVCKRCYSRGGTIRTSSHANIPEKCSVLTNSTPNIPPVDNTAVLKKEIESTYFNSGFLANGIETGSFNKCSYRIQLPSLDGFATHIETQNKWQILKQTSGISFFNNAVWCMLTEDYIAIKKGDAYWEIPGIPIKDELVLWPSEPNEFIETINHIHCSSAHKSQGFLDVFLILRTMLSKNGQPNSLIDDVINGVFKAHKQQKELKLIDINGIDFSDIVVVDTETTSLKNGHVIDIAVLNWKGEVLLSSLVKTDVEISEEAQNVHRITKMMLSNQPKPSDLSDELQRVIKGKIVCAYNAPFDIECIERTFGFKVTETVLCAMRLSQEFFKYKRWPRLDDFRDHTIPNRVTHRALEDSQDTLELMKIIEMCSHHGNWLQGYSEINLPVLTRCKNHQILDYTSAYNRQIGGYLSLNGIVIAQFNLATLKYAISKSAARFVVKKDDNSLPTIEIQLLDEVLTDQISSHYTKEIEWLSTKNIMDLSLPKQRFITTRIPAEAWFDNVTLQPNEKYTFTSNGLFEDELSISISSHNNVVIGKITMLKRSWKKIYGLGCVGYTNYFILTETNGSETNDEMKVAVLSSVQPQYQYSLARSEIASDISHKDL